MGSHVVALKMLQNNFSTEEMRSVWDDENRLQKILDVEAALALAESELGIIPKEAGRAIKDAAKIENFDIEEIAKESAKLKHSLMATVNHLQKLSGDYGEYVHYGVTTQDVTDTAMILQLKEADEIIRRDTKKVAELLIGLASKYKKTPMPARTHGMQGLPTTFGFKLAVVLSEFERHLDRLKSVQSRIFTGVLAGGVGTYAALGSIGPKIEERALEILELNAPKICWHSSRDRISEYGSALGLISGSLGKLGNEFYNLMRTEIDEVEEPFSAGNVGSTTMPHKRNPAIFEGIASLTKPILHSVALLHESLVMEHERDAMSWRSEWIALPEICLYLSSQLKSMITVLEGLVVKPENMLKNLERLGGLILSERVMFALSEKIGKQTAHHLIYEIAMESAEQKIPFKKLLGQNEKVAAVLTEDQINQLLDPSQYIGLASEKVDEVIASIRNGGLLSE
ncbi:adenylosuccinate lyase [Bacillus circulans]|jgi:adenylosuccinate lyase|uniref:adenylosuccinate lyase n=1 Tax=Niallia TaxID=2837506 RepID=UPI0013DDEC20|nr:adenylosuccinate lyase [Niallia circulans]NRG25968.1 adenylosuccinate lyase [Niallia circulans]QJX64016.1 adenylosuccinate lyase [Niallia circulans]